MWRWFSKALQLFRSGDAARPSIQTAVTVPAVAGWSASLAAVRLENWDDEIVEDWVEPAAPAARKADFRLASRLASVDRLNPPKGRTTKQRRPTSAHKPTPVRTSDNVKRQAPRRHVWLSGGPVKPAAARSAQIIRFPVPAARRQGTGQAA